MSRTWTVVSSMAARLLRTLPPSSLRSVESIAQISLGKGWGGATVEAEVAAGLSLLPKAARTNPVVLDVGANVGNWTAALLSTEPSARVFAFEPSSTAHAQLATRFAGNPSVELVRAAAGRETGAATLWADRPGSGLASLTQRRLDHFNIEFNLAEPVALVTLDEFCAAAGIQPVLVKLDVEGHELDVLAGATDVLTQVRVVQFEFGGCNIDTRTYWQDFFYLFTACGFTLYRLGPHGLDAIPRYSESDECFLTTNYFAVRG